MCLKWQLCVNCFGHKEHLSCHKMLFQLHNVIWLNAIMSVFFPLKTLFCDFNIAKGAGSAYFTTKCGQFVVISKGASLILCAISEPSFSLSDLFVCLPYVVWVWHSCCFPYQGNSASPNFTLVIPMSQMSRSLLLLT